MKAQLGAFAASRAALAERPAKPLRVRGGAPRWARRAEPGRSRLLCQAGLGRSLLRGAGGDTEEDAEDEEDEEYDEDGEDDGADEPRRRFENVAARFAAEAEAADEAERADRRRRQAAGGAYFASRRRGPTSTASLAELDLAGACAAPPEPRFVVVCFLPPRLTSSIPQTRPRSGRCC